MVHTNLHVLVAGKTANKHLLSPSVLFDHNTTLSPKVWSDVRNLEGFVVTSGVRVVPD